MLYFIVLLILSPILPAASIVENEAPQNPGTKLDMNDVSLLFPLPQNATDVSSLISIGQLKSADGESILPLSDFNRIIEVSAGPASKVAGRQIAFKPEIKNITAWKIAGIRFDPSAPGCGDAIANVFGRSPQIRLVAQPVTVANTVVVHDAALHLVFSFLGGREAAENGVVGKSIPEEGAAKAIVEELVKLKKLCKDGGVDTNGNLGIHPGLSSPDKVPMLRQEIAALLSRHLHAKRLSAVAVMGLNQGGPEPWIFVAMARNAPAIGAFVPVPSPGLGPVQGGLTANMVSFIDQPNVLPPPSTTNRNAVSPDLRLTADKRRGLSTSPLFANQALDSLAAIGVDAQGMPVTDAELKLSDIPDWIAHPEKCHFFNTDCASCHTESTRRALRGIGPSPHAYKQPPGVSPLDARFSPKDKWNVRNFGWFKNQPTITQRTANETAEVVEFVNRVLLSN